MIGIDIEETARFLHKKYSSNLKFYNKIFTKNEIKYCLNKSNPYLHFTSRFCAKEAAIKATGNTSLKFKDIEIKMKNTKPIIYINNERIAIVSLSHTSNYATAIVLLSSKIY